MFSKSDSYLAGGMEACIDLIFSSCLCTKKYSKRLFAFFWREGWSVYV